MTGVGVECSLASWGRSLGSSPENVEDGRPGVMVETVFYIILCLLTGLCGTYSRMGFVGTFLLALLLKIGRAHV